MGRGASRKRYPPYASPASQKMLRGDISADVSGNRPGKRVRMSQTTISMAANDRDLQARVQSAVYGEALNNPALEGDQYAALVRQGNANFTGMYWAVAVAVGAKYEAGILNGRGSPGHDADVISDTDILAAVQTNWPEPNTATPANFGGFTPNPANFQQPAPVDTGISPP